MTFRDYVVWRQEQEEKEEKKETDRCRVCNYMLRGLEEDICEDCAKGEKKEEKHQKFKGKMPTIWKGFPLYTQVEIEEKLKPLLHLRKYIKEYDTFPIGGYDRILQTLKNFGLDQAAK